MENTQYLLMEASIPNFGWVSATKQKPSEIIPILQLPKSPFAKTTSVNLTGTSQAKTPRAITSRPATRPATAVRPPSTRALITTPQSARLTNEVISPTGIMFHNVTSRDIAAVCAGGGCVYLLEMTGETLWLLDQHSIMALETRYAERSMRLDPQHSSACVVENVVYLCNNGTLFQADFNRADKTFYWVEIQFETPLPVGAAFCTMVSCNDTRSAIGVTDIGIIICKPKRKTWSHSLRANGPLIAPGALIVQREFLFAYSGHTVYKVNLEIEQAPWDVILVPESILEKGPPRAVVLHATSDMDMMLHVWCLHDDAITRLVISCPFTSCSIVDSIPNPSDLLTSYDSKTFATFCGESLFVVEEKIHALQKRTWKPLAQSVRQRSSGTARPVFPRPPSAPVQVPCDPRCGRTSVVTLNIKTDSTTSFRRNVKALLVENEAATKSLPPKEVTFDVQGNHPHSAQVSIGCRNTVPTEVQVLSHTSTDDLSTAICVDFLDASRKLRIRFCQKLQLSELGRSKMEQDRQKIEERWNEVRKNEKELEEYRNRLVSEWARLQTTEEELNKKRAEADALMVQLQTEREEVAQQRTELEYTQQQIQEELEAAKEHEKEAERRRRQEKEKQRLFEREQEEIQKKLEKTEQTLQRKIKDTENQSNKLDLEHQRMGRERESYKRDIDERRKQEEAWEIEKKSNEKKMSLLANENRMLRQTQDKLEQEISKLQEQDKQRREQLAALQSKLDISQGRSEGMSDYEWEHNRNMNLIEDESIAKGSFRHSLVSLIYHPMQPTTFVQGSSTPEALCTSIETTLGPDVEFVSGVMECEVGEGFMFGDTLTVDTAAIARVGAVMVPSIKGREDVLRIEFQTNTCPSFQKLLNGILPYIMFETPVVGNAYTGTRKIEIFIKLTRSQGSPVTLLTGRLVIVSPPMLRGFPSSVSFFEGSDPMGILSCPDNPHSLFVEERCLDRDEIQRLAVTDALSFGLKGPNAVSAPFMLPDRLTNFGMRKAHVSGRRCISCSQQRRVTNTGSVGIQNSFREGFWWASVKVTLRIEPTLAGDEILAQQCRVDSKTREIFLKGVAVATLLEGTLGGVTTKSRKGEEAEIKIQMITSANAVIMRAFLMDLAYCTKVPNPSVVPRHFILSVSFPSDIPSSPSPPLNFSYRVPIMVKRHHTPILLQGFKEPVLYRLRQWPSNPIMRYLGSDSRKNNNALPVFSLCQLIPQVHSFVDGGFLRVGIKELFPGDSFGLLSEDGSSLLQEIKYPASSHIDFAREAIQRIVFFTDGTTSPSVAKERQITLTTVLGNETDQQQVTAVIHVEESYIELGEGVPILIFNEKDGPIPIMPTAKFTTAFVPPLTFIASVSDCYEPGDEIACTLSGTATVVTLKEPLYVRDELLPVDSCVEYSIKGTRVAVFFRENDTKCYVRVGPPANRTRVLTKPTIPAAVVNEVLAGFTYVHTSSDPQQAFKIMRVTVVDEEWCECHAETNLRVVAVDDPTEIRGPTETNYLQGAACTRGGFDFTTELSLYDPDTDDYSGGFIKVEIVQGADPNDEIFVRSVLLQDPHDRTIFVDGENSVFMFENREEFVAWEEQVTSAVHSPDTAETKPNSTITTNVDSNSPRRVPILQFPPHSRRGSRRASQRPPGEIKPIGVLCRMATCLLINFIKGETLTLEMLQMFLRAFMFRNDTYKCSAEDRIVRITLNGGVTEETGFPSQPDTTHDMTLHFVPARVHLSNFTASILLKDLSTVIFKSAICGAMDGFEKKGSLRVSIKNGAGNGDSLSLLSKSPTPFEIKEGNLYVSSNPIAAIQSTSKELFVSFNESSKLDSKTLQALIRSIQFSTTEIGTNERKIVLTFEGMWPCLKEGPAGWLTLIAYIRTPLGEGQSITIKTASEIECVFGTPVTKIVPWAELNINLERFESSLLRPPMTLTANLGGPILGDKIGLFQDGVMRIDGQHVLYHGSRVATITSQADTKICFMFSCCPVSVAQTLLRRLQYEASGKREKAGTKRPFTLTINVGEVLPEANKAVNILLGAPLIEGPANGTFAFKGDITPVFGPVRVRPAYNFSGATLIVDLSSAKDYEVLSIDPGKEDFFVTMRSTEMGILTNKAGVQLGQVNSNQKTIQITFAESGITSEFVTKCLHSIQYSQTNAKDLSVTPVVDFTLVNAVGASSTAQVRVLAQQAQGGSKKK